MEVMDAKIKKSKQTFTPLLNPRYLVGSVQKDILLHDLEEYNKHRYHIFIAKKRVDDNPPRMKPDVLLKKTKLATDQIRLIQISNANRQLLKKIRYAKPRVDTYNPWAYADYSKWKKNAARMKQIYVKNKKLYKHIFLKASSDYARDKMEMCWQQFLEGLARTSRYPVVITRKDPTCDEIIKRYPSVSCGLPLAGPRYYCFMEFQIRDNACLGRIIIELYADKVPVTVQNFLQLCQGEDKLTYKKCPIHNMVKDHFLETGDITMGNGKGGCSVYGDTFAEENFCLKHTKTGVLSMIPVKRGENNSQFSITLTKIEKFDNVRVVFGKVVRGASVLFKINDMARRIGRPLVPIFISNCGEYVPKNH